MFFLFNKSSSISFLVVFWAKFQYLNSISNVPRVDSGKGVWGRYQIIWNFTFPSPLLVFGNCPPHNLWQVTFGCSAGIFDCNCTTWATSPILTCLRTTIALCYTWHGRMYPIKWKGIAMCLCYLLLKESQVITATFHNEGRVSCDCWYHNQKSCLTLMGWAGQSTS